MPAYATAKPVAIYPGDSTLLWSVERPLTGSTSLAAAVSQSPDAIQKFSVEISFSGVPGAFEIDVQDADTDLDMFYNTIPGAIITTVNAQNTARFELSPFLGRFVRLLMNIQSANNVNLTARANR